MLLLLLLLYVKGFKLMSISVVRRLLLLLVQKKMMRHPSVFLEYCLLIVTSAMKTSLVRTGRVALRCMSWVL